MRICVLLPIGIASADTCIGPPPIKPVRHICGIVKNELDERIANAKLILLKDGLKVKTVQADSNGKFDFGRIEAGKYDLRAESDGYHARQAQIIIRGPASKCDRGLEVRLALTFCGGGIGKAHR
jgi:hypothetical protein